MIRLPSPPLDLLCPVPAEVRQNHEVVAKLGWGFAGRVGGARRWLAAVSNIWRDGLSQTSNVECSQIPLPPQLRKSSSPCVTALHSTRIPKVYARCRRFNPTVPLKNTVTVLRRHLLFYNSS